MGCRYGDIVAVLGESVDVSVCMDRIERLPTIGSSDKTTALAIALLAGLLFSFGGTGLAEETTEHPFIEPQDIKSETCLTCHPDKKEGRFVHSAVTSGCESCHQAASENGKTTITLLATGGELCAMCHEIKQEPVMHGPYKAEQCMICHDPHRSNFPRQLRAETNTLCLSCHGVNQPDVKIDKDVQKVSMLGGQTLSFADYRQSMKIGLDRSGTRGHPVMGHPVAGKDPRHKDTTLSCLSCHTPHSSTAPNLLPADIKSDIGLCGECHQ
jgi:predicted CXXCH cytochrome family protein